MCLRVSKMPSLEELSLKSIYKHFSVFTSLTSTKDARLKKGLSFLRRVYSQNLMDYLSYIRELDGGGMEFLLNEYLKKLDLVLLLETSSEEMNSDKICKFAHNLEELSCVISCSADVSEKQAYLYTLNSLLPHAIYLTNVCLPMICNDETLKNIASSCPNLIQLNIAESREITSVGLKALCYSSNGTILPRCPLIKLDLTETSATAKDISFLLTHIPTLKELDSEHVPKAFYIIYHASLKNKLSKESIKRLNLTRLNFSYHEHSDIVGLLPFCAEICPNVRELRMQVYVASDSKLCYLFSSLDSLHLHSSDHGINLGNFIIANGDKLKHFSAYCFSLSVSTLITSCPNLESMNITSGLYLPTNETDLSDLKHLHSLTFDLNGSVDDCECTKSLQFLLNSCPNLERLVLLNFNFLNVELVTKLDKYLRNAKVQQLCFRFSFVQLDLLVLIILSSKTLKSLKLDQCQNIFSDLRELHETCNASKKEIQIIYSNFGDVMIYSKDFPSGLIPYASDWAYDFTDDDYCSVNDAIHAHYDSEEGQTSDSYESGSDDTDEN